MQRLYDEVMSGHNVDAADGLITIDRPDNDPTFPPEFTAGRAGFKKLMTMLIGAFPDLRFTTELMVADNDLVSAFTKVSGTHQGEFMGIPATGRSFLVSNADFWRFTDEGLICEHWGLFDTASLMRQLGVAGQVIPVTGATGLTGALVARQLSARRAAVRALVRDPARAGELAGLAGVEAAAGDMARRTLAGNLQPKNLACQAAQADRRRWVGLHCPASQREHGIRPADGGLLRRDRPDRLRVREHRDPSRDPIPASRPVREPQCRPG